MATTTDLTTLKINYLSQAQYDNALANNQINSDELYFTPADDGVTINLNGQNVQSPSFYAPTDSGTAGNFLKSGGSGVAPTWAALTSSEVITALGSQTKNYVLAAPSSANGTPSFRALVADDIPTLSIIDKTSGTLTVSRGGTGKTSWDINKITYASAANTLGQLEHASSPSYLLKSGSATAAPSWIQYTNANTASTIVQRDSSGNFSAGTITAALSGNATSATKANITTTTNAVAYYTDTTGTFGSKASANGALYATAANGSLSWGTLPVAQGGTGVTSFGKNSVIVGNAAATSGNLSYVASAAGALYSTGSEVKPTFGTLPTAYGGTGNTSQTANRLIYSESATKLSSSEHYASSTKVAINSTTEPTIENFYVNGASRFALGTGPSDDFTSTKKFIIGSSGMRYLSFGGAGIQAYNASNNASTLYLNYYGGNLIVGQNGYNGRVILDTTTAASNSTTPSLRVMQNAQITSTDVNHMAQFLASNMENGGANAIVLGKAVSANQAGGLLYIHGTTPSLSFGFVNNLGLLKITSSGSIYINSGSSNTHNTSTSELLVKGRVVVDTSYHNTNSFSEFRINRSTGGWSAITLGGAQGTASGAGLGVWLIGNKDTPANATTAAASITDSQFYISYNGSNSAACRIQGHNATGFSIRPRLAVNTDVNTSYNFYVNGTAAISDTLYLTRTTDASGTADNKPALMIGSSTGQHIEIDGNEILSKSNTTTPGTLYLQDDTGSVAVAGSGGLTVSSLTASQAVSTDANKKLVSTNLSVSDPSASGSGITYIATISQSATGKITATKSTVRDASTSQSGIVSTGTQQFKGRKGFGYLNLYAEDAGTAKRYIDIIGYNNAGTQIAEIYYDAGNTTNITTGIWRFKEFSPHSTADTTTTGFYEYYSLPVVAKDLTANQGYNILTSKSAVTIAQGGTGATTRLAAAKNLTSENVTSPDYVVSLTQNWANFGYTSIANLKTTLGMPQMQIVSYTGNDTLSMSITFSFAPDIIIALDGPILDNTTGITDVVAGPQICDMSRVTTSWQAVHFGGMSSTQSIGMSYYRSTASSVIVCSKSSNGRTYYVKVDTTLLNTLPQSMKDTWGAGTTLRIGEKAVYNYSGVVTRFLGIKI